MDFRSVIRRRVRPFGAPPPAHELGTYACRCCLTALEVRWQPGWANRPGHVIVTCRNAGCAMDGYTFSVDDYDALDLSRYRAVEHPEYRTNHGTSSQGVRSGAATR